MFPRNLPISRISRVTSTRRQFLKEAPEDWSYLWEHKQELSRRMTLLNDGRETIGAALRMLGYSVNSTNEQQVKKAYEKLVELD